MKRNETELFEHDKKFLSENAGLLECPTVGIHAEEGAFAYRLDNTDLKNQPAAMYKLGVHCRKKGIKPVLACLFAPAWRVSEESEGYEKVSEGKIRASESPDKRDCVVISGMTKDRKHAFASWDVWHIGEQLGMTKTADRNFYELEKGEKSPLTHFWDGYGG